MRGAGSRGVWERESGERSAGGRSARRDRGARGRTERSRRAGAGFRGKAGALDSRARRSRRSARIPPPAGQRGPPGPAGARPTGASPPGGRPASRRCQGTARGPRHRSRIQQRPGADRAESISVPGGRPGARAAPRRRAGHCPRSSCSRGAARPGPAPRPKPWAIEPDLRWPGRGAPPMGPPTGRDPARRTRVSRRRHPQGLPGGRGCLQSPPRQGGERSDAAPWARVPGSTRRVASGRLPGRAGSTQATRPGIGHSLGCPLGVSGASPEPGAGAASSCACGAGSLASGRGRMCA